MRVSDFDFSLPADLIASRPADARDQSRLLVAKRDGSLAHRRFRDIVEYLNPGDMILLNDTKVFPARLIARKPSGGVIDILLVSRDPDAGVWNVIYRGNYQGKISLAGEVLAEVWIGRDEIQVPAVPDHTDKESEGGKSIKRLRFFFSDSEEERDVIWRCGAMPLPPYIKRRPDERDKERYQTVYAAHEGSIAAPTAGLHFTEDLLDDLRRRGVRIGRVTLHVGPGTFRPIRTDRVESHLMDAERFEMRQGLLEEIAQVKGTGGRLITVGTTATRALEGYLSGIYSAVPRTDSSFDGEAKGVIRGETTIFIYPGYQFRAADGILTNFHLPRSTPLMLASAFLGRERLARAYDDAISLGYRFFSYGDAMLML